MSLRSQVLRLLELRLLVIVLLAAIIVAGSEYMGCMIDRHEIAALKPILDQVPLPKGTTLVSEEAQASGRSSRAFVCRKYKLPDVDSIDKLIVQELQKAGYKAVDRNTHQVDSSLWQKEVDGPIYHAVTVVSPDRPKTFISIARDGSELDVNLFD